MTKSQASYDLALASPRPSRNRELNCAEAPDRTAAVTPAIPYFSTWKIDWISIIPLVVANYYCVFDQEIHKREDLSFNFDFGHKDYMSEMRVHPGGLPMFVLATVDTIISLIVIIYHVVKPRHAKYYTSTVSCIAICVHMVGGSIAMAALYIGIWTGTKVFIMVACVAGLLLHIPTVLWLRQMVFGRRELIFPSYLFFAFCLGMCWLNILMLNASFESVMSAQFALHVFGWVRAFSTLQSSTLMSGQEMHDRGVFWAGVSHLPFFMSMYGVFIFCLYCVWWNFLFNLMPPFPRSLLFINRFWRDTFPRTYVNASGETFTQMVNKLSTSIPDKRERVMRAVFDMLGGDDEHGIELKNIEVLFRSWGIPEAKRHAKELFMKSDENANGFVDYFEYQRHMEFIFRNIDGRGELDMDDPDASGVSLFNEAAYTHIKPGVSVAEALKLMTGETADVW